jgi:stage III sporulation protein AH
MKILKRNQLIVLVISFMLITAGYLNFASNQENITTSTIANRDDATIGDAQLVSTIPSENEEQKIENLIKGENNIKEEEDLLPKDETLTSTTVNKVEQQVKEINSEDYYFTTSKLERNTMYSELLEIYQEIFNNTNSSAEEKNAALNKINEINNTKNAIMIAENLIIAKGFKDVVVFANEGSVSVIIKTKELKQEDVAKIQNIVSRELNVGADIIHISNK